MCVYAYAYEFLRGCLIFDMLSILSVSPTLKGTFSPQMIQCVFQIFSLLDSIIIKKRNYLLIIIISQECSDHPPFLLQPRLSIDDIDLPPICIGGGG